MQCLILIVSFFPTTFLCLYLIGGNYINIFEPSSDFYNWNKVKIRYCDGGSFSGNSEYKPQVTLTGHFSCAYLVSDYLLMAFFLIYQFNMMIFLFIFFCTLLVQNGTILFFRGRLIWQAIMDELLSLGLVNASQVFPLLLFFILLSD